ncbi:hypothetical protein [Actinosynnema sp. ALI-1.44]|uniref:hypothetical protein n=1 Tax=Actinosynnema sp. ALI-1.44 TaxID=1933779 RepID=UPI00192D025D|nr:hypothetical protein [Actinosynnema sp. ALI-1.44]
MQASVAGLPAALALVPDPRARRSLLLQALDPDLLAAAIGIRLAAGIPAPRPGAKRAIAVDGKTLRGSRSRNSVARHIPGGRRTSSPLCPGGSSPTLTATPHAVTDAARSAP